MISLLSKTPWEEVALFNIVITGFWLVSLAFVAFTAKVTMEDKTFKFGTSEFFRSLCTMLTLCDMKELSSWRTASSLWWLFESITAVVTIPIGFTQDRSEISNVKLGLLYYAFGGNEMWIRQNVWSYSFIYIEDGCGNRGFTQLVMCIYCPTYSRSSFDFIINSS